MNNHIDFAQMPVPDVVEPLNYEQILAAMVADLQQRQPEYNALLESDPAYKLLEVCAYRELALRNRINHAARATMLAYATGTDLDNLFPLAVQRQIIIAADPDANPPIEAVMESDQRLRQRKQLWLESTTTAGPVQSYQFHALSASPLVKSVNVMGPELELIDGQLNSNNNIAPGQVLVTILSAGNDNKGDNSDGTADNLLLNIVNNRLQNDEIRPLTDWVTVQSAEVIHYHIEAQLQVAGGPDATLIKNNALSATRQFVQTAHQLGNDINRASIIAALHVEGVNNVNLISPATDIDIASTQAGYCADIQISTHA